MSEKDEVLVVENMNLVYFLIRKYFPTFAKDEDLQQVGCIGLCRAVETWDDSKSTFSTYASKVIINAIRNELRARRKHPKTTSLNAIVKNSDDLMEIMDTLVGEEDVVFVDDVYIDKFLQTLSPKNRELLKAYQANPRQIDIAAQFGLSRQEISRRMVRIRKEWTKFNED